MSQGKYVRVSMPRSVVKGMVSDLSKVLSSTELSRSETFHTIRRVYLILGKYGGENK